MSDKSDPTGGDEPVAATKIPAGLETLYALEKHNLRSSLGVLILAVHWSIVRAGLRIPSGNSATNDRKYTERLPEGWSDETFNSQTAVFTYDYVDPTNPGVQYQVKVIEIVRDATAVVTVYRHSSPDTFTSSTPATSSKSCPTQSNKTSASTFQLQNFIRFDLERTVQEEVRAEAIFHKADDLEKQIWTELMEPLGLKVIDLPPFQGPYDDKVKTETSREVERDQTHRPQFYSDDPLRDDRFMPRGSTPGGGENHGRPPVGPAGGFGPLFVPGTGGGVGRSDLDPLGGIGAGMVADPRGFRTPRVGPPGRMPPEAVPPGARFDPFGPPNPNPNPNAPPGAMPNWAVPDPDQEPRPPGFDDMFM